MVINSLQGVVHNFQWSIVKGSQFIIMFYWHILHIFNRLRVIRLTHFVWNFPIAGEICGVFRENDPQMSKFRENTYGREGTSFRQTTPFQRSCVEIGSRVWIVRVQERQNKKLNKRYATRIFHHHVGSAPTDTTTTKVGEVVDPWDIITFAIYEIKLFIIVTWVSGWNLPFSTALTIAGCLW